MNFVKVSSHDYVWCLACSYPGVLEHGSRQGPLNFTAGARVRYSCDSNFHLLGSAESTCYCLSHKCQWLPAKPICTKGIVNEYCNEYCH